MTRTHRRSHLIAWLVLSPAILGLLIGALAVRAQVKSQLSRPASGVREVLP
jgi:hypothetical protein